MTRPRPAPVTPDPPEEIDLCECGEELCDGICFECEEREAAWAAHEAYCNFYGYNPDAAPGPDDACFDYL